MTLIDLSVPITSGMPVYPGDPAVTVTRALTVTEDGVNVLGLHLGSQSGTHVDAPFHIDDTLPGLDELPLERFVGPAVVVDARGLPPRSPIGPAPFAALVGATGRPLPHRTIVLVCTGWSACWGTEEYLAHPYLTPSAAELLVSLGIRTVGIDALSVDRTPADTLPVHRVLCGAHAVIAENLTSLDRLLDAQAHGRPIQVSMLPLRLLGSDGAPVRAVAEIGEIVGEGHR